LVLQFDADYSGQARTAKDKFALKRLYFLEFFGRAKTWKNLSAVDLSSTKSFRRKPTAHTPHKPPFLCKNCNFSMTQPLFSHSEGRAASRKLATLGRLT
jgi:hypothetical protein